MERVAAPRAHARCHRHVLNGIPARNQADFQAFHKATTSPASCCCRTFKLAYAVLTCDSWERNIFPVRVAREFSNFLNCLILILLVL